MAVDYFLNIKGIEGESTDAKHRGEIDVESWSWGETNSGAALAGGGAGAGKVNMQDLQFTARQSKATPKLLLACATGQHLQTAVLTVRKAGGAQVEYFKLTLTDVIVTSYQTGGVESDDSLIDSVSLGFAKIQVEHRPQKADGSLGQPITAGWDLKKNTKI
jgi:type VI secretion system secreted protein Hcp